MEKIKILFVLPNFMAGGAERVTLNIIRQLDNNRFDINLLLINDKGEYKDLVPSYVRVINLNKRKTIYSLISFFKNIKKEKPEIIFSSLNRTNILTLLSKLFYKESIIIIREPNMPSKELNNLPFFTKFFTKKLYRFATKVIAQTDEMRKEILQHFDSLFEDNVITITNPIDKKNINTQIKNSKSPFMKSNLKIIIAIGTLTERKGFDILLRAFKKVLEVDEKRELYILGKGEDEEKLISIAKELGIYEKVKFEGFQSNPYKYLKNADLFVLSSRYEGLPNVVLESLYIGTPVVITNCVPFISKTVIDSNMGYVVEINEIEEMALSINKALDNDFSKSNLYNTSNYDFNQFFISLKKGK